MCKSEPNVWLYVSVPSTIYVKVFMYLCVYEGVCMCIYDRECLAWVTSMWQWAEHYCMFWGSMTVLCICYWKNAFMNKIVKSVMHEFMFDSEWVLSQWEIILF